MRRRGLGRWFVGRGLQWGRAGRDLEASTCRGMIRGGGLPFGGQGEGMQGRRP